MTLDAFIHTESKITLKDRKAFNVRGGQPRKYQDFILSRLENYQAKFMLTVKTRNFQVGIDIAAIVRAFAVIYLIV